MAKSRPKKKSKAGHQRKATRRKKQAEAKAADDLEQLHEDVIEKIASGDGQQAEDSPKFSAATCLDHRDQLALVQQAIRGRWLTDQSAEDIGGMDLRTAKAKDVALAMVLDTLAHGDAALKQQAIRSLIQMEGQNQKDQLAAFLHGQTATPTAEAATDVQINVQIVNDLRRELLGADDVLEAARREALDADSKATTVSTNGHSANGNGHVPHLNGDK